MYKGQAIPESQLPVRSSRSLAAAQVSPVSLPDRQAWHIRFQPAPCRPWVCSLTSRGLSCRQADTYLGRRQRSVTMQDSPQSATSSSTTLRQPKGAAKLTIAHLWWNPAGVSRMSRLMPVVLPALAAVTA